MRWAPSEDGSFQRLTVERVDGKLILSEGIKILDMKATSGS